MMTIKMGTETEVAAQIAAVVGFPVYVSTDRYGLQIAVTDNGCYGPGGAEGDLVLSEQIAKAIGQGALVAACGIVTWDFADAVA